MPAERTHQQQAVLRHAAAYHLEAGDDERALGEGDSYPMYFVSHNECEEFCKKLSKKTGLKIVLPTEAQWEYACRAGTTTRFHFGNDFNNLYLFANYSDINCPGDLNPKDKNHNDHHGCTAPVRSYKPNQWGLYDMHGNVSEWCSDSCDFDVIDSYDRTYFRDPTGSMFGHDYIFRGGGWGSKARDCRSACRCWANPNFRCEIGFRIIATSK